MKVFSLVGALRSSAVFAAGAALCLAAALPSHADALASLSQFLQKAHSGQAQFTQVVTEPAQTGADGKKLTPRERVQSGTFAFSRPSQFRFDYQAPYAQIIVADGKTLWLYDVDLNQVTSQSQDKALSSTPAAVIATASNLSALSKNYVLSNDEQSDDLEWVLAVPKTQQGSQSSLKSVRVGFKTGAKGVPVLSELDILDALGQRSRITFNDFKVNDPIDPSRFSFTVPMGADVVAQ